MMLYVDVHHECKYSQQHKGSPILGTSIVLRDGPGLFLGASPQVTEVT